MLGMLGSPRRLLIFTALQSTAVSLMVLSLVLPEAVRPFFEETLEGRPLPKLTEFCLSVSSVVSLFVSRTPSFALMLGVVHFYLLLRLLLPTSRPKAWLTVHSTVWTLLFLCLFLTYVGVAIPQVEIIQGLGEHADALPRRTVFLRIFSWTIVALLTLTSLRRFHLAARKDGDQEE